MNVRAFLLVSMMALPAFAQTPSPWARTGAELEAGQVDWPDTPAARWAEGFFEAFSTEGKDSLRRFIKEYYSEPALKEEPLEKQLADYLGMRRMLGELTIHSAKDEGDFAIDVIVYSKTRGGWGKFRFELSPKPPHDLTLMSSNPSSPPDTKSAKDYNDWRDLRDLLERIRHDTGVPAMAAAIVHVRTLCVFSYRRRGYSRSFCLWCRDDS
ncbi:MAG: hypothetical protein ACYTFA_09905 [Planctomycetota bacterium]